MRSKMRKLISIIFIFSTLSVLACGSAPKSSFKNVVVPSPNCKKYHINIDYGYTEKESVQIMNAWNVWADILGDKLSYDISRKTYVNDQVNECVIQVQHKLPPDGYDGYCSYSWYDTGKTLGATILINEPLDFVRLNQVAIHEFGHSLDLDHDEDTKSIMHFDAPVDLPSCGDKMKLCEIWNCSTDCLSAK